MKILAVLIVALLCIQHANSCLPLLGNLFGSKNCAPSQPAPKPQPKPLPQPLPLPQPGGGCIGLPAPSPPVIQPLPIYRPQPFPLPDRDYILPVPVPLPTPTPIIAQSSLFTLSLQWACRQGVRFDSCQGSVIWNGQVVQSIRPSDYGFHSLAIQVAAKVGQNTLQLRGQGISDSFGLTVDNVKLVRHGTCVDIVVNGGFEQPWTSGSWGFFNNIPGWAGHEIQIGAGKIYSCQWNSQVCELDGNRNYDITQYFNFDCEYNLVKAQCY